MSSDDPLEDQLRQDAARWHAAGGTGTPEQHERLLDFALRGRRTRRIAPLTLAITAAAAVVVIAIVGAAVATTTTGSGPEPAGQSPSQRQPSTGCSPARSATEQADHMESRGPMPPTSRTRSASAVLIATTAATLTACTSSSAATASPHPATSTPRTSTHAPSSSTAASSSPASATKIGSQPPTRAASKSATSAAAPPPAVIPACTNNQIKVQGSYLSNVPAPPASVLLRFTNTSTTTCTLTGYPGVTALSKSGKQLAQASRTLEGTAAGCGCSHYATVTLKPGKTASTAVEYDHTTNCAEPVALLVTPPNTTRSTRVNVVPDGHCAYQVHPVIPGSTGFVAH